MRDPRWLLLCLVGIGSAAASVAKNISVTTVNDSGPGSLRQAIIDSNVLTGVDTITFNIPGGGVHVIVPLSALPAIVDPVIVDGYTQPGASPNTLALGDNAVILIEIDGTAAGIVDTMIEVQASDTTIRGLSVVNGWTADGIAFLGGGGGLAAGNFVGLLPDGITGAGNGCAGIRVGAPNTTVGGPAPADRNVISGATGCGINLLFASTNGIARGNYIGTSKSGTQPVGGAVGLDLTGSGHQIGGTGPGEGNVISGNNGDAVRIRAGSSGNALQGNFIGTDPTGTAPVHNSGRGVAITDSSTNVIGGGSAGAGNVISGNGGVGVLIQGASSDNQILRNSIHDNGAIGIDLGGDGPTPNDPDDVDSGPNNLQNFPVLASALATPTSIRIQGTLNAGIPFASGCRIEFFSSPACDPSGFGEGETFLGSADVRTDAFGNAPIDATFPAQNSAGNAITATATIGLNTSEFSACLTAAPQPMAYFPLPPCRVVDTRNPNGPLGGPALASNAERTFVVSGTCGVPSSAIAASFNVAVTLGSDRGDLRIFPAGTPLPLVSAINYNASQTRSDDAVIGLGAAGDVTVHVDQPGGTVHLILDVTGYFQ
jgi:parallel beta-helix repeat protein